MSSNLSRAPISVATTLVIAATCTVLFPAVGSAQDARTKAETAQTARRMPPPQPEITFPFGIARQDLFDRNNPNNRRSDYPPPPAQPGQF
jgi:hypothetical protein